MSGGSFNYLCFQGSDKSFNDLKAMRKQLKLMAPESLAYKHTNKMYKVAKKFRESDDDLENVWHEIEWWVSYDISEAKAYKAIAEYEEKKNNERDEALSHMFSFNPYSQDGK